MESRARAGSSTSIPSRTTSRWLSSAARRCVLCPLASPGAPETIDRFLHELTAEEERTRLAVESREVRGERDLATGHRPIRVISNEASVRQRLTALRVAHTTAEALCLEPIDEAQVLERLTLLRDSVPDVEPLTLDQSTFYTPAELRAIR
jgi:hypothetical protein